MQINRDGKKDGDGIQGRVRTASTNSEALVGRKTTVANNTNSENSSLKRRASDELKNPSLEKRKALGSELVSDREFLGETKESSEESVLEELGNLNYSDKARMGLICDLSVLYIKRKEYSKCEELILEVLDGVDCRKEVRVKLNYNLSIAYIGQEKYDECEKLAEREVLNCSGRIQAKLYNSMAVARIFQAKYNKALEAVLGGLGVEGCSDGVRFVLCVNLVIVSRWQGVGKQELIELLCALDCSKYIEDYVA